MSPVFNTRGLLFNSNNNYTKQPLYDEQGVRKYISVENNLLTEGGSFENAKGVVKFSESDPVIRESDIAPIAVDFRIDEEVFIEIKKFCSGLLFVRQKRIPTILAQALTVGVDPVSYIPLLKAKLGTDAYFFTESFLE
ncbi:MAG: hypothetical protein Nk1A_8540 [Endomicrobiia bacterium]|nr:MAG: hypothetical protein Nk1A_8540 [Endomicrobiia bacterium]